MSDSQELKDAVAEYDKARKAVEEKLKTIAENQEKSRPEQVVAPTHWG